MKRSEIIKTLKAKLKESSVDNFQNIWNHIFEEEQIDKIYNKKDKQYFIDLFEDEVHFVENKSLVNAYKKLKS